MKKILFLCTGNSCRSIMAEGIMQHYGKDQFLSLSAGSHPTGKVHPLSLETLRKNGINADGLFSKSWDSLENHKIDIVITVCDNAASESCPVFLGSAMKAHFGVEDPAKCEGSHDAIKAEFSRIYALLERKIKSLLALDIENMSEADLQNKLNEIAQS